MPRRISSARILSREHKREREREAVERARLYNAAQLMPVSPGQSDLFLNSLSPREGENGSSMIRAHCTHTHVYSSSTVPRMSIERDTLRTCVLRVWYGQFSTARREKSY